VPYGFARHELGILVPATVERADVGPALNASVYLSHRDLTGKDTLREPDLVERLSKLSAADCLWAIARLSTRLAAETRPAESARLQGQLVRESSSPACSTTSGKTTAVKPRPAFAPYFKAIDHVKPKPPKADGKRGVTKAGATGVERALDTPWIEIRV
jgi:hypothetical protein